MKTAMLRTCIQLPAIALLAAVLAVGSTGCVAYRVESSEQITKRMLDYFGIQEGPAAWVNKMAGPVDPGVEFTGVWRNPEDGFEVTIRQTGNTLYVLKAGEKHSESWSVNGSTAYHCGFGSSTKEGVVFNVLSIWRATLLNENTMQWNIEQGVTAGAFRPIERLTRTWMFNRISSE